VGDEVRAVKPGDFVSARCTSNCGHCHQCGWGRRISARICALSGSIRTGRSRIREDSGVEYLEARPGDSGALRGDSRSAGECGAHRDGGADRGADGFGYGMRADWADVHCGGEGVRELDVFATETNEQRRAMAKKMGADLVLIPRRKMRGENSCGNQRHGVDALLEMSGNPTAIQQVSRRCRAGGRASRWGFQRRLCRWIW